MCKNVPVHNRHHEIVNYFLVDDVDYEQVSKHRWFIGAKRYPTTSLKGGNVYLHRFIMNPPDGMSVDHIDGNPLNACRDNLRVCSQAENCRNSIKRAVTMYSKFKGVSYDKTHKSWKVCFRFNRKQISAGTYNTEIAAARAYDAYARAYYKEFANLNFPNELITIEEARKNANPTPQERLRARIGPSGYKFIKITPYGKFTVSFCKPSRYVGTYQTLEEAIVKRDEILNGVYNSENEMDVT